MNGEDYNNKMIDHKPKNGSYRNMYSNLMLSVMREVKKVVRDSKLDEKKIIDFEL